MGNPPILTIMALAKRIAELFCEEFKFKKDPGVPSGVFFIPNSAFAEHMLFVNRDYRVTGRVPNSSM